MPSDTQRIVSTDTRPYARLKSRDSIFCQGENRDASTRSKGEIVVEVNQVGSSYERHSLPSTQTEVVTTGRISTRNTTIHPAEGVNGRDSHEIEAGGRNRTPAARGSKSKSWKPITAKPPHKKNHRLRASRDKRIIWAEGVNGRNAHGIGAGGEIEY